MRKLCIKAASLLLCTVLCFSLSSCLTISDAIDSVSSLINPRGIAEDVSLGYTEIDFGEFSYSPYYTPIFSRESYKNLENDKMRELYDMLYYNCYLVYPRSFSAGEYKCKQVILEEAQLTQAQIRLTIKAIGDDNPHVFWLSDTFGFLIDESKNYTAVQLYSRMSPEKLTESISNLKAECDKYLATLKDGLSDYELEKSAHDYILKKCEYDTSLTGSVTVPKGKESAFDPYGALVEGVAVCEGYSRAFQLLCNSTGLSCINIVGVSENELHMWNAVQLGEDYYYVDVTWDDKDEEAFMYDYFNISEKQLLYDHEFSPLSSEMSDEEICGDGTTNALTSNFFIPKCTKTEQNYYEKNSVHLKSYDSDEIEESLLKSAENKESYFHFYIEPNEFTFDYAVDDLFFSYPQYFFKYIDNVNYLLPDYSIDTNNLSLYQKKQLSVVTVVLKYI
ncbi:MAG: hypothetical protein IJE16_00810 [Ruminococcus sp.]|nr:hypothetical protein [Ruminococcus sp.]